ncbi:hypothetical protein C5167_036701 [Papaver somniferum]|uniref:Uncharacterized protein n=1 Tax=Papaver somniferum TaxID=3469 RepID=A0A4Y7I7T5_PAPSO|nr:hypothetical protein C5167_036701 [Papaver somniferum]
MSHLLLAKCETEQTSSTFKIVLEENPKNVPALLGQFSLNRYTESLDLYKRALQVFPNGPAAVRLGIGFCRYKLGQLKKDLVMRLSKPFKIFANHQDGDTLESDLDSSCALMNSDTWIASGFDENHLEHWPTSGKNDSTKGGHSAAHIKCVQLSLIRSWRYKEIAGVKVLRLRIVAAIRYTIS